MFKKPPTRSLLRTLAQRIESVSAGTWAAYPVPLAVVVALQLLVAVTLAGVLLGYHHTQIAGLQIGSSGCSGMEVMPGENKVRLGSPQEHKVREMTYRRQQQKAEEAIAGGMEQGTWDAWLANSAWYACPVRERIGSVFDGGKWLCAIDALINAKPTCTVFSFGSAGEVDFEQDVMLRMPHCKVYVWDPSLAGWQRENVAQVPAVTLYEEAIAAVTAKAFFIEDYSGKHTVPSVDVLTAVARENLTWVDVMKMDIESFEFEVLFSLFERQQRLPATFFLVEVHLKPFEEGTNDEKAERVLKLCRGMRDMGFRLFSQEPNLYAEVFSWTSNVVELAFINVDDEGLIQIGPL